MDSLLITLDILEFGVLMIQDYGKLAEAQQVAILI
jgi:hypothetical protein